MASKEPDNNHHRRRQSPPPSLQRLCRIPDDVLCSSILPRLPFKSLSRFAAVSKSWRRFICSGSADGDEDEVSKSWHSFICWCSADGRADGGIGEVRKKVLALNFDRLLAVEQPLHPSPASVAFVRHSYTDSLSFFPSASSSSVGIPDTSLSFAPDHRGMLLVASTNGLLCLVLFPLHFQPSPSLYVVNPATMRGELVPGSRGDLLQAGLAFDPSTSPDRYVIVIPKWGIIPGGALSFNGYAFDVFSSETGRWVQSPSRVPMPSTSSFPKKSVYFDGVLCWNCRLMLLWYDVNRNTAGSIWMPDLSLAQRSAWVVGVHGSRLACVLAGAWGLAVYLLSGGRPQTPSGWELESEWTKIHEKTWEAAIAENSACGAFDFCRPNMQLQNGAVRSAWPLAVGGRKVYLGVKLAGSRKKVTEILCYDFMTGKLEKEEVEDAVAEHEFESQQTSSWVFEYHNSMVALPKIKSQHQN